jgi:hypothetical protein
MKHLIILFLALFSGIPLSAQSSDTIHHKGSVYELVFVQNPDWLTPEMTYLEFIKEAQKHDLGTIPRSDAMFLTHVFDRCKDVALTKSIDTRVHVATMAFTVDQSEGVLYLNYVNPSPLVVLNEGMIGKTPIGTVLREGFKLSFSIKQNDYWMFMRLID